MIGELVARYKIGSRLGSTGTGELWQGTRPDGATATIQVLPAGPTSFAASYVTHPTLAHTLETGVLGDGQPYLVLAPVRGTSLDETLERTGQLSPATACDIAGKIARAIHALHRARVVHGGLSSASIYVDGEHVTVLDAGLAMHPTTITAPYAAPELWRDATAIDGRADIYALGCLVYQMASGRTPFDGATFEELAEKHTVEPVESLLAAVGHAPRPLAALVARMLEKSPADRPLAASELSFVFELVEDNEPAGSLGPTLQELTRD